MTGNALSRFSRFLFLAALLLTAVWSAALTAGEAPAPDFKLQISADSLPTYIFGTDTQTVTLGLGHGYGVKQSARYQVAVLGRGEEIVAAAECQVPEFEGGTAQLRVPLDLSRIVPPVVLTVRARLGDRQADYPALALLTPAAQEETEKQIPENLPRIYCLPSFDETRLRRWEPVYEFARMGGWLPFLRKKLTAVLPAYGLGADAYPALIAASYRDTGKFAAEILDGCAGLDAAFIRLRAAPAALERGRTALLAIGTDELENGVPVEVFTSRVEALVALLQSGGPRRIYVAAPPACPARPELRAAYVAALGRLCDKRSCRYLETARPDDSFITAAAPAEIQKRMAETVVGGVSFGPGLIILWTLPFLALSFAFWWLRSRSRFVYRKS